MVEESPPRWRKPAETPLQPGNKEFWRFPGPNRHRIATTIDTTTATTRGRKLPPNLPFHPHSVLSQVRLLGTGSHPTTTTSKRKGGSSSKSTATFRDLSLEDKVRLSQLVKQLAVAEVEKTKLNEELAQLQQHHQQLLEQYQERQQQQQVQEQPNVRASVETLQGEEESEAVVAGESQYATPAGSRNLLVSQPGLMEERSLPTVPASTKKSSTPIADTTIQKDVQDLKHKFDVSASLLKRYHKRISKLQQDRDLLLQQVRQLKVQVSYASQPSSPPSRRDSSGNEFRSSSHSSLSHSHTTSLLESIRKEVHQLSDVLLPRSTRSSSSNNTNATPTTPRSSGEKLSVSFSSIEHRSPATTTSAAASGYGGGGSAMAFTEEDIQRIVDQLSVRLQSRNPFASSTESSPGENNQEKKDHGVGRRVMAALPKVKPSAVASKTTAPQVPKTPPRQSPHPEGALTPTQSEKIRQLLIKSKQEAMETSSIAFTNVPSAPRMKSREGKREGTVGQEQQREERAEEETQLLERFIASQLSTPKYRERLRRKSLTPGETWEVPLPEHSHSFRKFPPPVPKSSGSTTSAVEKANEKLQDAKTDITESSSVFLFRDDTSMVTSLTELVEQLMDSEHDSLDNDLQKDHYHHQEAVEKEMEADDLLVEQQLLDDLIAGLNSNHASSSIYGE